MSDTPTPLEILRETRQLAELIEASLPKAVDAASLTLKSKLPFTVLSLRELLLHRVSALASPAVALYEQGMFVSAVVLTRAVLETVSLVFALHKQIAAFLETKDVNALDQFLMQSLFASRWEDASYQTRSILTFVDHVEKKIPGFRRTYDALSEYAHPNWSGVSGAFGELDTENHILALGQSQRTTIFASGVSALSGSLLTVNHYYNDMVQMLYQLNEHFELQGDSGA